MNLLPIIAELNFAAFTFGDWVKIIIGVGAVSLLLFSICGGGNKGGNKGGNSNQSTTNTANTTQTQPPANPQ